MFGLIGIALLAETFNATTEQRGADPIAAGIMTIVFAVMTYLFATTRVKDYRASPVRVGRGRRGLHLATQASSPLGARLATRSVAPGANAASMPRQIARSRPQMRSGSSNASSSKGQAHARRPPSPSARAANP